MDLIKSDILNWQFFKLCYPQINFNFFIRPIFYLTFSFSSLPLSGLKKKRENEKKNNCVYNLVVLAQRENVTRFVKYPSFEITVTINL